MGRCRDLMWLMLAGGLAGCLESNPQPSPFGDDAEGGGVPVFAETTVDEERILASAAGEDGAVVLVGMDGAAAGAEHAEARAGDAEEISFPVDMAGGFGAVVEVPAGAKTLELAFRFPGDDGPTTVTVTLAIPVLAATKDDRTPWFANADAEYDPDAGAGSPPQEVWEGFAGENGLGGVVVTLEGGTARVTGLEWTTTPLSLVAVVNQATFVQAVTSAGTTGAFVLEIPASSGDTLLIYAINPSETDKATAATAIDVP